MLYSARTGMYLSILKNEIIQYKKKSQLPEEPQYGMEWEWGKTSQEQQFVRTSKIPFSQ
jgi:hypothetical protein